MNNLTLWESVEKTDLQHTKTVDLRGGYTAIDPAYQAKMATEQFGPYGKGWGLASSEFDTSMFEVTRMIIHKAVFFFVIDGERSEFPISNTIFPMPVSKGTEKADEEWAKKVETNTISKSLARLGFNADVFLGKFDDAEYKELLATEQAIEKAEDKEKVVGDKQRELREYVTKQLDTIKGLGASNATSGVAKVAIRHLERQSTIPELKSTADRGIQAVNDAKATAESKAA